MTSFCSCKTGIHHIPVDNCGATHSLPASGLSPTRARHRAYRDVGKGREQEAEALPGGGVDRARRQWRKIKGKYLFNEFSLAKVFRARILAAINDAGLTVPNRLPAKWIVDCESVGKGEPALEYLSRYLYRGVIAENNIIANHDGKVTFRYVQSKTGKHYTVPSTVKTSCGLCSSTCCRRVFDASGTMVSCTVMPKSY